jgi:hypothetical protein
VLAFTPAYVLAPRARRLSERNTPIHAHIAYSSHMWPRYPKHARRAPRSRKIAAAMRTSKRADGYRSGPSVTNRSRITTPKSVNPDAASSVARHGSCVRPRIRCGDAEPTVRAPMRTPIARPRSSRNHVAMIFIAGGYTPARNTPVSARRPSAIVGVPAHRATAAFAIAASVAPTIITVRGENTSGRLSTALTRVPTMNPS